MTLPSGTRLGPYEILSSVGIGGMGEVYRARDSKLHREVAVKVLPDRFSADPGALLRFEQEARAVAALSHPNILAIHDFGSDAGHVFAVTELLEGETLRRKLAAGALPLRRAVDYSLQIVSGLAAAHEKGIIHRDLKPENVFVTRDGRVKILDFGLAKIVEPRQRPGGTADDATLEMQVSGDRLLGTFGYMAPEQIRGRPVDARSDIFSFGALLYEMLSGRRAFPLRDSPFETLNAVLKDDAPPLPGGGRGATGALEALIRRCLEKEPELRFQSIRDVGFAVEAASGSWSQSGADLPAAPAGRLRALRAVSWPALAAFAVAAALIAAFAVKSRSKAPPRIPSIEYLTYSGHDYSPAASPDGRSIAFASDRDGHRRIWIKDLTGGGEAALTSGEDDFPRFSPDGTTLLFVRTEGSRTSLYRKALVGGDARRLIENSADGDWSPDGRRIAFVRWRDDRGSTSSTIGLADRDGGDLQILSELHGHPLLHPRFSPDGGTIAVPELFGGAGMQPIYLVPTRGGAVRSITPFVATGWLSAVAWTGASGQLIYSQVDSAVGVVTGSTAHVHVQDTKTGAAGSLLWTPGSSRVLDIVGPGSLVFDVNAGRENLREIPISRRRKGDPEGRWLTRGSSSDRQPAYSPDGEWVIFSSNRGGNLDLWALSTRFGSIRRVTDSRADDWDPAYTPDGRRILWSSNRGGHFEIWAANADGSNARQLTNDGLDAENPTSTPDGEWVVYNSYNPAKIGIWKIRPDGTRATRIVAGNTLYPETSPDGRFVVYRLSPEPGRASLRVARIADGATLPFQVSLAVPSLGAGNSVGRPRWLPDGRSVAFVAQDARGGYALFSQAFDESAPAAGEKRQIASFDMTSAVESFGVAPDGSVVTIAVWEQLFSLMIARNVSDLVSRGLRR